MPEEITVPLAVILFGLVSLLVTLVFSSMLTRFVPKWRLWARVILAGILPTALIVIFLAVWHVYAYQDYLRTAEEGWMSPLLILLYGFPIFISNLVVDIFAAYQAKDLAWPFTRKS